MRLICSAVTVCLTISYGCVRGSGWESSDNCAHVATTLGTDTVQIHVDPSSSEPFADQIAFAVKSAIARGKLAPGEQLPTVRELAKRLVINPNTVARAYRALEAEGVIHGRQGSGSYVTQGAPFFSERERNRRLDQLIERLAIEAFHLGFEPEQVLGAVQTRLNEQAATRRK